MFDFTKIVQGHLDKSPKTRKQVCQEAGVSSNWLNKVRTTQVNSVDLCTLRKLAVYFNANVWDWVERADKGEVK